MKIEEFTLERIQSLYENTVEYNLSDSGVHPYSLRELLTPEQQNYAACDVLNLHALRAKLDAMLVREGRDGLARACFAFLPQRALLDVAGWEDIDIFAHS